MADNYKTIGLERYKTIETRESQLWLLAVVVMLMLALALFMVDWTNTRGNWWFSPQIKFALNSGWVRGFLVCATLIICAYFRDSARRLRRENNELIFHLAEYGSRLENKSNQAVSLKDLSEQLIGSTELDSALDLIIRVGIDTVAADTASIMLREKDGDALVIAASYGIPEEIVRKTRVSVGEGLAGMVAKEGKPVVLNSDELDGEVAKRAVRGDTIVSSVIIPILVDTQVRGVLSTAKRRGGSCFNDEDMAALSTLANQASLVVEKMDLLDHLRHQVETLADTVRELRQTRAELLQSEKLANIGQLASGVAHEINNPLQVVLGRTELLLAKAQDDSATRNLEAIREHTVRIADIVSTLLSFSRQSNGSEFREMDVNAVLSKTLSLLEPQMAPDDIDVVTDMRNGILPVYGSAGQLQQVFTNIVLNAYHAMRSLGGGTLTVTSGLEDDEVVIDFTDSGPGIPQEHLEHIFEPFFTTKAEGEGTGLGLAIVYGIVQSHRGNIRVTSEAGNGTCFSISLPELGSAKSKDRRETGGFALHESSESPGS
ncbi:MAG: ATP-binding protein [Armatimonadetes bacterium]|nr:ATP-binding protein [Armatimonadota bacterium]